MVRKTGSPDAGELVIVRITKINPHSAYAHLEEYNAEGLIHISEVERGWVRDIRNHLRVGDMKVAKVMRVDSGVSLSIKRVDRNQENNKLKEYRLEQRAEKMLELAAKRLNKTLDQAYKEVGFLLQQSFGSMYAAFKAALTNPQQLAERVPNEWASVIKELAEKNIELKEFEFRANVYVRTLKPDGVSVIRSLLVDAQKRGLQVKYIAAPKYLATYSTKNAKRGGREFEALLEGIKSRDADVKIEMLK